MEAQNNQKNQNKLPQVENPKNNNKLNEIKNGNKNSINEEILNLKKEIMNIKNEQMIIKQKNTENSKIFNHEIELLKNQIQNLTAEINELKNKKSKNKNIIKNENIINNSESDDDEDMDDNQIYTMECLTKKLKIEILQGTEKTDIDVVIRNNSKEKYPNDSYLVCDHKNSLLLCEKVKLNELEPFQQQKVSILFKNIKFISKGEYRCIVKLQINNKMCNSYFEIIVNVLESVQNPNFGQDNFQQNFFNQKGIMPGVNFGNVNQGQNVDINQGFGEVANSQIILMFKEKFSLYNNDSITDEMIREALQINNFDFNKAFEYLFQ